MDSCSKTSQQISSPQECGWSLLETRCSPPAITRRLIEQFAATAPATDTPAGIDELTPRELEVFRLVARGMSNAEIANQLFIGETTVKTHVTRVLMKLGVRDRVQAVVLAYEAGIVSPSRRRSTTVGSASE